MYMYIFNETIVHPSQRPLSPHCGAHSPASPRFWPSRHRPDAFPATGRSPSQVEVEEKAAAAAAAAASEAAGGAGALSAAAESSLLPSPGLAVVPIARAASSPPPPPPSGSDESSGPFPADQGSLRPGGPPLPRR